MAPASALDVVKECKLTSGAKLAAELFFTKDNESLAQTSIASHDLPASEAHFAVFVALRKVPFYGELVKRFGWEQEAADCRAVLAEYGGEVSSELDLPAPSEDLSSTRERFLNRAAYASLPSFVWPTASSSGAARALLKPAPPPPKLEKAIEVNLYASEPKVDLAAPARLQLLLNSLSSGAGSSALDEIAEVWFKSPEACASKIHSALASLPKVAGAVWTRIFQDARKSPPAAVSTFVREFPANVQLFEAIAPLLEGDGVLKAVADLCIVHWGLARSDTLFGLQVLRRLKSSSPRVVARVLVTLADVLTADYASRVDGLKTGTDPQLFLAADEIIDDWVALLVDQEEDRTEKVASAVRNLQHSWCPYTTAVLYPLLAAPLDPPRLLIAASSHPELLPLVPEMVERAVATPWRYLFADALRLCSVNRGLWVLKAAEQIRGLGDSKDTAGLLDAEPLRSHECCSKAPFRVLAVVLQTILLADGHDESSVHQLAHLLRIAVAAAQALAGKCRAEERGFLRSLWMNFVSKLSERTFKPKMDAAHMLLKTVLKG